MKDIVWKKRPFLDLLFDSFQFYSLSVESKDNKKISDLFARSSVLNSILCLEACSNCCLDIHPFPKSLLESIEKFTVIDKFEFLLITVQSSQKLDRGSRLVQSVSELFKVRNLYVHPKIRSSKAKIFDANNNTSFKVEIEYTSILKFPKSSENWNHENALCSIKVLVEFLNHFFIDLVKYKAEYVNRILFPQIIEDGRFKTMLRTDLIALADSIEEKIDIKIKFVNIKG